jgi:glucosamine-6-phosphate deaminase
MNVKVFAEKAAMGQAAAGQAATALQAALAARGHARMIACTGASQFEVLAAFTRTPGIAWANVEVFHLDEYAGLKETHPASFRKYLRERLVAPTGIRLFHAVNGERDPAAECARLSALIREGPIDLAFVGIGENGHLAFNDPPADFDTEDPYIVVNLDEACRRQQVGEGWFAAVAEVPAQAISMSVRQILKAREIVCTVPDARKAQAVKACLEGPVSNLAPASILQTHPNVTFYLDRDSASLLERTYR